MIHQKTERRKEVMGYILMKMNEGVFVCLKELSAHFDPSCEYGDVYHNLRKCIKVLEDQQMLVKEKLPGTTRKILKPTLLGLDWYRPTRM